VWVLLQQRGDAPGVYETLSYPRLADRRQAIEVQFALRNLNWNVIRYAPMIHSRHDIGDNLEHLLGLQISEILRGSGVADQVLDVSNFETEQCVRELVFAEQQYLPVGMRRP